jgi:hypothetical protein
MLKKMVVRQGARQGARTMTGSQASRYSQTDSAAENVAQAFDSKLVPNL